MNREKLKELGLTDEQIESIMAAHGSALTKALNESSTKDETISNLQEQLANRDKDLKKLQKSVKDNEELSSRFEELQEKYTQDTKSLNDQISKAKFDSALTEALGKTKARDPKDIRALLNMDEVKFDESGSLVGLDMQLENLQKEKAYLFDLGTGSSGYEPNGGQNGKSYSSFEEAMKNNDVDTFLKQQAEKGE